MNAMQSSSILICGELAATALALLLALACRVAEATTRDPPPAAGLRRS